MQNLLEVILPVFLVMGFGYLAAWRIGFTELAVDGLMSFAQNFAVPVLLFRSIARLDLGASYGAGLMLSFYIGALAGFGLGFVGARLIFRRSLPASVAIGFCCLFSNTLLLGLPITERAYGTAALAGNYAIISLHAPLLYSLGIIAMEVAQSRGAAVSGAKLARQIAGQIAINPMVIGITLGFVVNIAGIAPPTAMWSAVMWSAVDMVAAAAIPAALFGLGGVLVRYRPEGDMKAIAMVAAISLIAHPAITYVLGRFGFGLSVDQLRSAVLTAAMAPGVNAYVFANTYGVANRVVASSVLIATAVSILSIWIWLAILP